MKKSIFKKLGSLFLGLAMGLGVAAGVTAGNKASEVSASDTTFNYSLWSSKSYAEGDGDHTSGGLTVTSSNVYQNSSKLQWKSNSGYIYNKTAIQGLAGVTINGASGSFTIYYGSSQKPTASTTLASGDQFFQIKAGGSTPKCTSFTISVANATYTVTYDANGGIGDSYSKAGSTFEDNIFAPPSGKKFSCWNTSQNGSGTDYNVGSAIPSNNLKVYAKWVDATYGGVVNESAKTITYDLTKATYDSASEDEVLWLSTIGNLKNQKSLSSTKANNYIPEGQTSTRVYNGQKFTISVNSPLTLNKVEITAKSESYANAIGGDIWTNVASKSISGTLVTLNASENSTSIIANPTATAGIEKIVVYYKTNVQSFNVIKNIDSSLLTLSGADEVDENAAYSATLAVTNAAGYNLPSTITVKVGNTTLTSGTDYTYNSSTGAINVLANKITDDLTITASAVIKTFTIDKSGLSNILVNDTGYEGPIEYNNEYYAELTPVTGYKLDGVTITVKMGGKTVTGAYEYSNGTGIIGIDHVTGDVVISGSATKESYPITRPTSNTVILDDKGYQTISYGGSYTGTLSAAAGYTLDKEGAEVIITMGSVNITDTAYNIESHEISISPVTGAITISATAVESDQPSISIPSSSITFEYGETPDIEISHKNATITAITPTLSNGDDVASFEFNTDFTKLTVSQKVNGSGKYTFVATYEQYVDGVTPELTFDLEVVAKRTLTVTKTLNKATASGAFSVQYGQPYTSTIRANNGYAFDTTNNSVVVTMGGVTLTDVASYTDFANGTISIPEVTGNIVITLNPVAIVATGITVDTTTNNVQQSFNIGSSFNSTGLITLLNHNFGEDTTITGTVTAPDMYTEGNKDVVVSYSSFTSSYQITVNGIDSIEVSGSATGIAGGSSWDTSGLSVTATYKNSATREDITSKCSFVIEEPITSGKTSVSALVKVTFDNHEVYSSTETINASVQDVTIFRKFTGEIVEGDYIVCGTNDGNVAMKNTVSSNRTSFETVNVSNDEIVDPLGDKIWHISESDNEGYYVFYNAAANGYLSSTGTKNQIKIESSVSQNSDFSFTNNSSSYEFINKVNKNGGVNANLRYNPGLGFACYGTGTGTSLTLYKKVDSSLVVDSVVTSPANGTTTNINGENNISVSTTIGCDVTYSTGSGDKAVKFSCDAERGYEANLNDNHDIEITFKENGTYVFTISSMEDSTKKSIVTFNVTNIKVEKFELATSLRNGDRFTIAAVNESITYIPTGFNSSKNVYDASSTTVKTGNIIEDNNAVIFTLVGRPGNWQIKVDGKFLSLNQSGAECYLADEVTEGSFEVSFDNDGLAHLCFGTLAANNREIEFNYNNGNPRFGSYSPSGTQTKVKVYASTANQGTIRASAFEEEYIKIAGDYPTTIPTGIDTGNCRPTAQGGKNYYLDAKTEYSSLDATTKEAFATNDEYQNARDRFEAWALANGETIDWSSASFSTRNNTILTLNNVDNSVWVISAVALVGLTAIGGYFFYRKRKENF